MAVLLPLGRDVIVFVSTSEYICALSPPLVHLIHFCVTEFLPVTCCSSVMRAWLRRREVDVKRNGLGLAAEFSGTVEWHGTEYGYQLVDGE